MYLHVYIYIYIYMYIYIKHLSGNESVKQNQSVSEITVQPPAALLNNLGDSQKFICIFVHI
jgi:hypothetical protein